MHITAQGPPPRLRNDLYCVGLDVKVYYAILYHTTDFRIDSPSQLMKSVIVCNLVLYKCISSSCVVLLGWWDRQEVGLAGLAGPASRLRPTRKGPRSQSDPTLSCTRSSVQLCRTVARLQDRQRQVHVVGGGEHGLHVLLSSSRTGILARCDGWGARTGQTHQPFEVPSKRK